MRNILKHFNILNISAEDNPFITLNLLIADCKDISNNNEFYDETLCVAILDNIISEKELKTFFSKFGRIKSFNILERKHLSTNFKNFVFCVYITYEEKNIIENILSYSVHINDYFKQKNQAPFIINFEKKNFLYFVKKYYDNYYNLYNGRKIIINDILNLCKENKVKKKLDVVDEDGFTVVQRSSDKPEFMNSIFSSKNEKFNYFKKKKKKKVHENFYLFRKKENFKNTNDTFKKKKINIKKKMIKKN
ncbi:conserved Plasmodium protein, unknown function [Plasmodium gallinaceum]|uniref:Ribosomal RNA-processing protein 7 C-terminal domain-containing protein n=1 Tax=Plasmodium gallinaceum TaxID=5849 RepID=A0A1J1GN34_PLAGA|nr:conserved Plasmodium protein, unknown function [Plasmodium gallinaceum]CRG93873.1 conserved Plasmodium protein, unknown function [Plasmodium gallinaceum]